MAEKMILKIELDAFEESKMIDISEYIVINNITLN
jgi:hypothetical protein